jgi:hypothetical protein
MSINLRLPSEVWVVKNEIYSTLDDALYVVGTLQLVCDEGDVITVSKIPLALDRAEVVKRVVVRSPSAFDEIAQHR